MIITIAIVGAKHRQIISANFFILILLLLPPAKGDYYYTLFTPQYKGLENIYRQYKDKGFEILAFPSNDFMGQEPGTNEQIKTFCQLNYQVGFPLFSKISVKGENIHPLYKFLTEKSTNPKFAGSITWNFNKFLIDRKGNIVNRFDSRIEPQSPEVIKTVEEALQGHS